METDFGGEIVKSKNTRRLVVSPAREFLHSCCLVPLRQTLARTRMPVLTQRKKRLSHDVTFKTEQNCTRAHPDALDVRVLRVIIASA